MKPKNTALMYALGMLGISIPVQAFENYMMFYYVETLGLLVGTAALARSINSVWNAVNDPLFGYLSDRTRTRWGRRRPWMLGAVLPFLLTIVVGFSVPGSVRSNPGMLFTYFLGALLLQETFVTIMWTNYSSLFPVLFRGLEERSKAAALKHSFQLLALIIGIALTPLVYGQLGFTGMAITYCAVALVLILLSVQGSPESIQSDEPEPLGIVDSFRQTLSDRAFWIFALASTLTQFTFGLLGAGMPFYAKYSLGLGGAATSALFGAVFLVAIPMVALWSRLARRWGGKRAWLTAIGILAGAGAPLYLAQDLWTGMLAGGIFGLGFSGVLVVGEVMQAHIIDRDAERTGRRREGVYYSVNGFVTRISGALQGFAFGSLALIYGYQSGEVPGSNPGAAFRFLMGVFPLIAVGIAFLIARLFPWDVKAD